MLINQITSLCSISDTKKPNKRTLIIKEYEEFFKYKTLFNLFRNNPLFLDKFLQQNFMIDINQEHALILEIIFTSIMKNKKFIQNKRLLIADQFAKYLSRANTITMNGCFFLTFIKELFQNLL